MLVGVGESRRQAAMAAIRVASFGTFSFLARNSVEAMRIATERAAPRWRP